MMIVLLDKVEYLFIRQMAAHQETIRLNYGMSLLFHSPGGSTSGNIEIGELKRHAKMNIMACTRYQGSQWW